MHSDEKLSYKELLIGYQPSVLIVDDDSDNLLFASYIVQSMGFRYQTLSNGEKCLEVVKAMMPDVILLDIIMPKVSGLDIAIALGKESHLNYIPLVAVTGLNRKKHLEEILQAGFDSYILKPYLIEDLERQIVASLTCNLKLH